MSVADHVRRHRPQPRRRPRQGHRPSPLRVRAAGRRRRLRGRRRRPRSPPGEIDAIDPGRALALPGVLAVISHDNAPRLGETDDGELLLFQSDTVHYRGQIVAAVVAETLEAGPRGRSRSPHRLRDRASTTSSCTPRHPGLYKPDKVNPSFPDGHGARRRGAGARRRRGPSSTRPTPPPPIHNNAMEPHATPRRSGTDGDLTLYDSIQGTCGARTHARPGLRPRARARPRRRPARRRRLRLQGHAAAAVRARRDRRAAWSSARSRSRSRASRCSPASATARRRSSASASARRATAA